MADYVGKRLEQSRPVEQLARWWTAASQEERFRLLRVSLEKNPPKDAPSLQALQIAIYLAEAEGGEIDER